MRNLPRILLAWVALAAACAPAPLPDPVPGETVTRAGLELPAGYTARVAVEGLEGPTQMIKGPDGRLWVAQLAGEENEGVGEILAIDFDRDERRVVLDGLLKPTGIAVLGGYLWIVAKRDLLRAPLDEEAMAGPIETVQRSLPYNGRSNSTLTVSPEGDLIYATSGARFGGTPIEGSATVWRLNPAAPSEPEPLSTGLKNAYAHTVDARGRLWVTEIADDPVNGRTPPDELNLLVEGADYGWPKCYGEREPALNYGGTAATCLSTMAAAVTFPPRSTPTSLIASPWESDTLLVALWLQGVVVRVSAADGRSAGGQDTFIKGLRNPQDILVWDDNTILVSDHSAGKVYEVWATLAGEEIP